MASLAKLVCLSSAIHQINFMLSSQMPFAIGQVQDAGLIFLSRMATSIAVAIHAQEMSPAELEDPSLRSRRVASTAVVLLGISTATLGLVLVGVGRARLAKFVSYLPMPVIGGYLAFIGKAWLSVIIHS